MEAHGAGDSRERPRPYVERARQFRGWRFDDIAPRVLGPPLPWSYTARASELLLGAAQVLDLGTGGGETFEEILHGYRGRAVATEDWDVNAPVAASRLRPRGVDVVRCRSAVLPFRDGTFDVVLDRHEELDPRKIARVLATGGHLLTQQVGRDYWKELRRFFPRMQDFGDPYERYRDDLSASGLTVVDARVHRGIVAYRGLEEITFMLCVTPWTIPEFDPLGRDLPALLDLERNQSTAGGIVMTESYFLIEASKPV